MEKINNLQDLGLDEKIIFSEPSINMKELYFLLNLGVVLRAVSNLVINIQFPQNAGFLTSRPYQGNLLPRIS